MRIINYCKAGVFLFKYCLASIQGDYIVLDTPTHGNLGDHAIVLAEKQFIKRVTGRNKVFEVTATEFNMCGALIAKLTPENKDILVPGGGFLGTLWPAEEYRFRRILKLFPDNRVIVFPQTVTFDMDTEIGRTFFEDSHKAYAAHTNLVIFVREQKSLEFMQKYMPEIKCELVPDIVMRYKFDVALQERRGILLCMRADCEKILSEERIEQIKGRIAETYPNEFIEMIDTVEMHSIVPRNRENEVINKLNQFCSAKLIVTDRLHGMIFAAITNTPCIAFGNSNGKVEGVYQWIKNYSYIRYANDMDDFIAALRELNVNQEYAYDRQTMEKYFDLLSNVLMNR